MVFMYWSDFARLPSPPSKFPIMFTSRLSVLPNHLQANLWFYLLHCVYCSLTLCPFSPWGALASERNQNYTVLHIIASFMRWRFFVASLSEWIIFIVDESRITGGGVPQPSPAPPRARKVSHLNKCVVLHHN